MWIVPIMQILEDLLARGLFYPNPGRYQQELKAAGIFVERMEVAMVAVLHKAAHNVSDEKFAELYHDKLALLDDQQRREIRDFWSAAPQPGLIAGTQPVAPSVGNMAFDKYVDLYSECVYDMNYKIPADQSFAYSSILQLKYPDGQALEIDFEKEMVFSTMTSAAARDAMAQGRVGRSGRIFPAMLAPRTVPRLWRAREEALRIQNEDFKTFATVAMTGVAFVLTVPTMPAGIIEEGTVARAAVRRRRIDGVASAGSGGIKPYINLNTKIKAGHPEYELGKWMDELAQRDQMGANVGRVRGMPETGAPSPDYFFLPKGADPTNTGVAGVRADAVIAESSNLESIIKNAMSKPARQADIIVVEIGTRGTSGEISDATALAWKVEDVKPMSPSLRRLVIVRNSGGTRRIVNDLVLR
ncbi:MAG: hypothetical protein ABSF86_16210 [Steroidobacteraceae bacterium]